MDDHDINWIALIPLSFIVGLAVLVLEINGLWPGRVIRPDLVWCLAFFATRRATPANALAASAWCGLARDLTLGPRLGAATLAYLLVAIAFLYLRELVAGGGFFDHAALFGALVVAVSLLKSAFDFGVVFFTAWADCIVIALGCGLATLIAYPVMHALLAVPWLCPTRARRRTL